MIELPAIETLGSYLGPFSDYALSTHDSLNPKTAKPKIEAPCQAHRPYVVPLKGNSG